MSATSVSWTDLLKRVVESGQSNDVAAVIDLLKADIPRHCGTDLYHVCVERASDDDVFIMNQLFELGLRPPSLQQTLEMVKICLDRKGNNDEAIMDFFYSKGLTTPHEVSSLLFNAASAVSLESAPLEISRGFK